jgi:hypothetical protein
MVARRRRHRFEDLDEVIEALDRWIEHRGGDTDMVPARARRRRAGTFVALGAAAVAVAATAVAWTLIRSPEPSAPPRPTTAVAPARAVAPPVAVPRPPAIAAAAIVPAPIVTAAGKDPVDADEEKVALVERPTRRPSRRRPSRTASKSAAAARAPVPTGTPSVIESPPSPARAAPPPPPPPVAAKVAAPLQARLLGVDVQGSLSQAVIQRAVERVRPQLERCTAEGTPYTGRVQFTIDESRRAHSVRGSGSAAGMSCVVSALGAVRTEAAPDTGDAEVVVRIAFGTRS